MKWGLNWACFERYIVRDMSVLLWHRNSIIIIIGDYRYIEY